MDMPQLEQGLRTAECNVGVVFQISACPADIVIQISAEMPVHMQICHYPIVKGPITAYATYSFDLKSTIMSLLDAHLATAL